MFNQVSFLDKTLFAKHLALMIKSGLPLRESVATIQGQSKSKNFKKILGKVIKSIDNGQSLAESLSRHSRVFDPFYINMIRIGEESGTLEENLSYLVSQLKKSYELRKKIQAAMLYPAIILTAVTVLGTGLIFFVLPKIVPVFKTFNIELPLTTRILIRFTEIVQDYGLSILIGIGVLTTVLFLISRFRKVKFLIHRISLKIPVVGSISRNVNISNLSRTLGILLKSGLPLVAALNITQETLGNLVYQKELEKTAVEVQKGKAISSYLKKREAVFPLMVSRTVEVGEKTGNLEETLLYLGDFYDAEVDRSTRTLSTVLEPILLLTVGIAVGFVVLAIITPIYEITRGLHL